MRKEQLTDTKIMKVLAKHTDILQKYRVKRIGLFGSYVRGTQTDKSDIDFLVEFKQPSFDNFMDLVFSLEDLFGKKIELITSDSLSPYIKPYVEKEVQWYEAS
ncbi:MAG: nucleotidyltransferase family protein [Candidatus Omnitrophota bacterium]